jgi:hypothetical protein
MTEARTLSCAEVDDLAGLFVLDALEPAERVAVEAHLSGCPEAHQTFADLGAGVSAMPLVVQPRDAPAGTRERVLAAVANAPQSPDWPAAPARVASGAGAGAAASSAPVAPTATVARADLAGGAGLAPEAPRPSWSERLAGRGDDRAGRAERSAPRWASLAASALAVVLVTAGVVVSLQRQLSETDRLQLLRSAVAAAADPATTVAPLTGSGSAAGAIGYAIFPPDGEGYVVVDGLPAVGEGLVYQVWLVGDGDPVSAGLLDLGRDGLGSLTGLDPEPGTAVVALSVEERPGAAAPTTDPVVVGEVRAATA